MAGLPQRGALASLLTVLLLLPLLALVSGAAAAAAATTTTMTTTVPAVPASPFGGAGGGGSVTTTKRNGGSTLPRLPGPCTLQLAIRDTSKAQRMIAGHVARVSFELSNLGASPVGEATVTVQLPSLVSLKSAFAARLGRPLYNPATRVLTWSRVSLKAGSHLDFSVHVKADHTCVPTAPLVLLIRAVQINGGQPSCPVQDTATMVHVLFWGYCGGSKGILDRDLWY